MWRLDININCLLQLLLHFIFFKIESLIESGTHQLARLSDQEVPGSLLSPYLQSWGIQEPNATKLSISLGFRRSKLRFSCLWCKDFTKYVISKAPWLLLYREIESSFSKQFMFVSIVLRPVLSVMSFILKASVAIIISSG